MEDEKKPLEEVPTEEKEELKTEDVEPQPEETPVEKTEEPIVPKKTKEEVAQKIKKQIAKNKEKFEGKSRIMEYLKTEHKWENYLFLVVSIITLLLGVLMLTDALIVKENFPLIGKYPDVFAWILVVVAGIGTIYALYPFFKPAIPEFKKITWLTWPKFLGNATRVLLFLVIFTLLFLLYDAFITQILARIFS